MESEGISEQTTQDVKVSKFQELCSKLAGIVGRLSKGSVQEIAKEPEPEVVLKPSKEKPAKATGLGLLFQTNIASLDSQNLPPILDKSRGASPLLATNEDLPETTINQVRESEFAPNGYIYGVGFGNILSISLLFPEDEAPRAILTVDILPEAVIAGRVVARLLADTDNFQTFGMQLRNEQSLRKAYQAVLNEEQNALVSQRLQNITFEQLQKKLLEILDREYLPQKGIREPAPYIKSERLIVMAVLRDNYDRLHELAKNGNIGVGYADMINSSVLGVVKEMPEFASSRNIVYMSNVIDHLTDRGTDPSHVNDMNVLSSLGEGKDRRNWFIDTTQKSQNYRLRASHSVPRYHPNELI